MPGPFVYILAALLTIRVVERAKFKSNADTGVSARMSNSVSGVPGVNA
jgi:hypothetical protein